MQVTRFSDAQPYEAKAHFQMQGLQMQGGAASETEGMSVSLSYFLPGGGAEHRSSPTEKVYVVLEGELTVRTDGDEVTLGRLDSIHLARNEARSILNKSKSIATILVVILS